MLDRARAPVSGHNWLRNIASTARLLLAPLRHEQSLKFKPEEGARMMHATRARILPCTRSCIAGAAASASAREWNRLT